VPALLEAAATTRKTSAVRSWSLSRSVVTWTSRTFSAPLFAVRTQATRPAERDRKASMERSLDSMGSRHQPIPPAALQRIGFLYPISISLSATRTLVPSLAHVQ